MIIDNRCKYWRYGDNYSIYIYIYVLFAFVNPPQAQSSQKLEDWPVLFMKLGFAGISRFTSINICTRTCTLCSIVIIILYIQYNYIHTKLHSRKKIYIVYMYSSDAAFDRYFQQTLPHSTAFQECRQRQQRLQRQLLQATKTERPSSCK